MNEYIVYSNTDYLDILQIQSEYFNSAFKNTILFLNDNSLDLKNLYDKYKKVIHYDNNLTYASRLLNCILNLNSDYILLTHDIDILLSVNNSIIDQLFNFARLNSWDRIDLKYTQVENPSLFPSVGKENDLYYLIDQTEPSEYLYNVNPSIWKRTSLIEILTEFSDKTYRTVEGIDVQYFCKKYKIYKIFNHRKINCGYFECVDAYTYLHITHGGKLLTLTDEFKTEYGQSYQDVSSHYLQIVDRFNLKKSAKWVN
jgi:hypothetical protein